MADLKDVPHPTWDLVKDGWLSHIPPLLIASAVPVETLLRLAGANLQDKQEVDLVTGVRERTFADILVLREKAIYCFHASTALLNSGFSTWTLLSMYDASFFSAKALIYILGVRDASRGSKDYLSLFYTRKLKKQTFDGHFAFRLKERMTHDSLWSIFSRLVNTVRGEAPVVGQIKGLRVNDYSSFTRERNFLSYEAASWSRMTAIDQSDLNNRLSYLDNKRYLATSGADTAEYTDKYYRTAQTIVNLIDELLSEIGVYAPAVANYLLERPGLSSVGNVIFT